MSTWFFDCLVMVAMATAIIPNTSRATTAEISVFETLIKASLPQDYREFLLTSNGGSPDFSQSRNIFFPVKWNGQPWADRIDGALLEELDSISQRGSNSLFNSFRHTREVRQLIPADTISMGDASGGALLLGVGKDNYGKVFYWCQDFLPAEDGFVPDYNNVGFVANSFAEFLQILKPL